MDIARVYYHLSHSRPLPHVVIRGVPGPRARRMWRSAALENDRARTLIRRDKIGRGAGAGHT
jgi:hypothetical protein